MIDLLDRIGNLNGNCGISSSGDNDGNDGNDWKKLGKDTVGTDEDQRKVLRYY